MRVKFGGDLMTQQQMQTQRGEKSRIEAGTVCFEVHPIVLYIISKDISTHYPR